MQTNIEQIDFVNVLHIKENVNIYIGHEAELEICTNIILSSDIVEIKNNILLFYQKLCKEILSRINICDKRLSLLKVLDPVFIKSAEDINYFEIVSVFTDIITNPEDFVKEFKLLENRSNDKSYEAIFKISKPETFWYEIGHLKNCLGDNLYPNLYKFASYVFTLPHSSASAERIFSKLALLKNKLTNRLKVDTCQSMLSALNLYQNNLEDWIPSDELINKYKFTFSKN